MLRKTQLASNPNRQRGVGLIEVLIAVLVMTIGLLGLAGLLSTGIKANTSSVMRTQSVILASSILDSIRANPGVNYTIGLGDNPPGTDGCEGLAACNAAAIKDYDLAIWKCSLGKFNGNNTCAGFGLQGVLPEGDGEITRNGNVYTVTIEWVDDLTDVANPKQFTMSAQI